MGEGERGESMPAFLLKSNREGAYSLERNLEIRSFVEAAMERKAFKEWTLFMKPLRVF